MAKRQVLQVPNERRALQVLRQQLLGDVMSFIVMGRDECNLEFRPSDVEHLHKGSAFQEMQILRECYPESRAMWVELLRDKDFFMQQRAMSHDYDREDY